MNDWLVNLISCHIEGLNWMQHIIKNWDTISKLKINSKESHLKHASTRKKDNFHWWFNCFNLFSHLSDIRPQIPQVIFWVQFSSLLMKLTIYQTSLKLCPVFLKQKACFSSSANDDEPCSVLKGQLTGRLGVIFPARLLTVWQGLLFFLSCWPMNHGWAWFHCPAVDQWDLNFSPGFSCSLDVSLAGITPLSGWRFQSNTSQGLKLLFPCSYVSSEPLSLTLVTF